MTTINKMLVNIQNQPPALLQVGGSKAENYQNLASLTEYLWSDNQWPGLGSDTNRAQDMVSLAYKDIGQKLVSEMAGLTAESLRSYPGLENDYLIALIDTDSGREARVYKRSEVLAAFEGSGAEKKALETEWAANPLQVFGSAKGLPAGSSDPSCLALAAQMNNFLKSNFKTMNTLKSAGFDTFQNFQGSSATMKALSAYLAAG
jgi:hypothetical protein